MSILKICHLYPNVLNLYGDRGNIICMQKRLEWRNIDVEITELPIGEMADFTSFDLFFIGGGQDFEQEVLTSDLFSTSKAQNIRSAVNDGKVFLAICGGYQMMGSYYKTWDGQQFDFINAVDMYTVGGERMIGNYIFECTPESGGSTVVGFENHSGKTYLGSVVSPLGRVIKGYGNNGQDGTEGCRYKNFFGTYSHGPLLPKNPEFADHILKTALERKYGSADLSPLDDALELNAHSSVISLIS
jgi:Predicted glutamine amidotransferase